VAVRPVVKGREQDALVEVDRWARHREGAEQPQDTGAATDLRGAGGTTLDVGGQAGGIGRPQLVEQERIDERASASTVQRVANVRVRHIIYMT
jgi:hypothetical protein